MTDGPLSISLPGRFHPVRGEEGQGRGRLRPEVGGKLPGAVHVSRGPRPGQEEPGEQEARQQEQAGEGQAALQQRHQLLRVILILLVVSVHFSIKFETWT